jgi:glycosyltransferase involved in cell wall biosynthesis
MKPGISIILCCHNSEKRLPEVLESLSFQKGINDLRWEILVVNNASTDNTVRVAEEYRDKYLLPVKILNEPQAGLSFARMTGIKASVYSFICYVDDDNRLDENYISTAYRLMTNHEEIGLVGGCGSPVFESEPPFWFDKFQRAYAVGPQGEKAGYMTGEIKTLYGAGVTLRKSAWLKMESNGFTYHVTGRKGKSLSSGEDSELCYAIQLSGYKLWYDPH